MKNVKAFSLKLLAFVLVIAISLSVASFAAFAEESEVLDGQINNETDETSGDADETEIFTYISSGANYIVTGVAEDKTLSGEVIIPSEYKGASVIGIDAYAFADMDKITSVVIPASVTFIGTGAFENCSALEFVNFSGSTLESVGINAFAGTLWFDNYEESFVFAGKNYKFLIAYKGTDKNIDIPVTVEHIGDGAFYGNEYLETVTISKGVKSIGESAFRNCKNLIDVNVRGIIDSCGSNAFKDTAWYDNYSSEFIFFGDLLLKYKGNAEVVKIPNTFTKIAADAFAGCVGVRIISVPSTIKVIGANAFFIENVKADDKYAEIYCFKGTYAEEYAVATGLTIASYLYLPGDFNNNGKVEVTDARSYLRYAVKLILLEEGSPAIIAGDINGDGKITSSDARIILRMAVKIESFTPEDMLLKPNTEFEILNAYANAIKYAAKYEAGFTKRSTQEMTDFNLNLNSRTYLSSFKNDLVASSTQKVEPNDTANLSALYLCSLVDSSIIKSAKCVIDNDYNYVIEIVFNDEPDSLETTSLTSRVFPVVGMETFNKQLESRWWYKMYSPINYNLTYKNCTLKAVINMETGRIKSADMSMQYAITDIAGKLGGIKIKDGNGKDNGNALRTDKVFYSDFIF